MHHIDRTLQELETSSGMNGEFENGYDSGNGEFGQEFELEANYENDETFETGQDPEMELAYQLLEVSNEYELNQFLGGLVSMTKTRQKQDHKPTPQPPTTRYFKPAKMNL